MLNNFKSNRRIVINITNPWVMKCQTLGTAVHVIVLLQEFWSWKFWSAGPKFSPENMVHLCKNWSGLMKTLVLHLLSWIEHNTTRQQFNKEQPWQLSTHLENYCSGAMAGRVSHAIVLIKAHHPYLHELATLPTYFANQTICLGFVILYRHFDTNVCR